MENIKQMWYVAYTTGGCKSPDPVLDQEEFDYISLRHEYNTDMVNEVALFFSEKEAQEWIDSQVWDMDHDDYLTPTPIDLEVGDG